MLFQSIDQVTTMAIKKDMEYENLELSGSEPETVVETPAVETPPVEDAPSEEIPAEKTEDAEEAPADEAPVVADDGLFELPDGRRVTPAEAQREWKENFLPEFTRKSQRLADLEKGGKTDITNPPPEMKKEWQDPDYVPKSYAEIVEIAKAEAIQEIQSKQKAEETRIASVRDAINEEVASIKKIDPKLDENVLFAHANKYGFQSLTAAHQNMKDMQKAVVHTEQKVIKNLKTREADPVSDAASPASVEEDSFDQNASSNFDNASDYLAFLKSKK